MDLRLFGAIALVNIGVAQTTPGPTLDAFEVATIKPTPADWRGGAFIRMQSTRRFEVTNYTLKALIGAAYDLTPRVISGGMEWVQSDHFNVLAVTPGEARPSPDQQMLMLRQLLADRFRLAFHREQKEFSIYTLNIGKGGSKLRESTMSPDASPEGPPPLVFVIFPGNVRLSGRSKTLAELASVMQRGAVDRPVVDKTGLSGRFDFDLEFTPDETQFGGRVPPGDADFPKPDLFAAIQQQLGLRLVATKGPIDAIVIDRAERPSEN